MKGFNGNKTLLPMVSEGSPYEGSHPILLHILKSLPNGPKALVVNYKKKAVIDATQNANLNYCEQPELNGTGGESLFLWRRSLNCKHEKLVASLRGILSSTSIQLFCIPWAL